MRRIASLTVAGMLVAVTPVQAGGPNEALGTILGAAGGGLLGAQIGDGRGQAAATVAGVALGAIIGNSIGRDADRGPAHVHDRRWRSAPLYQRDYYPNYSSSYVYVDPVPAANYRSRCRQVTEDVYANGWPRTVYRTVCRQPDGTWRIVR